MKSPFYQADDPFCEEHEPDDKRWCLDHFYKKLLKIFDQLHTLTARNLATQRTAFLEGFLHQLRQELGDIRREM